MWAILNTFGIGRFIAWVANSLSKKSVKTWLFKRWGAFTGLAYSLSYALFPGLWDKAYEKMQDEIDLAAKIAAGPAAAIIKAMTDMPISADMLGKIASGGLSDAERNSLGDWFVDILDQIFLEDPIAAGYLAREPGTQERLAFRRFVGRNAQLQLAGVMIDLLKDRLPSGLTVGLGEIAERLEKIVGYEDAQEELMEPLMEKLIITGLEKRYNRLIKPTDLSPEDAVSAYIRDLITPDEYKKILDNEGIRLDIRETLVALQAKNLTEADFRDLYQRGFWFRDDVFRAFRSNGYLAGDAELKTELVVADRESMLRKELLNVKESQFVKGVLTEAELRSFLGTMYFSALEEDLEIEIAKGKAAGGTAAKPKAIAGSFNVAPWRVKQGASAVMSWNIRNADNISITGIGTVQARGEQVIQPDSSQTYVLTASNDTENVDFQAVVEVGGVAAPSRPSASFYASPGRIQIGTPVELRWNTTNADTVIIDGIGSVAEAGVIAVYPIITTIYTLTASNPAGQRIVQDIVFVEYPDIEWNRQQRPGITFSISPSVVSPGQPQAEAKWSIKRASGGTLIFPDGTTQSVSDDGAQIITATASGVYTLKATNEFGDTQKQEGLIWDAPAVPAPQ